MKELQKKQLELDKFIYNKQGIPLSDLKLKEKVVALDVELSEFANEIEFFKYWKVNKGKGKDKIIEEACDCLHFILSIANTVKAELNYIDMYIKGETLTDMYLCIKSFLFKDFLYCGYQYNEIDKEAEEVIDIIFNILIKMIKTVGFTYEDLIKEYDRKYEINIQRQKEGY